jgi:hypothetical protein
MSKQDMEDADPMLHTVRHTFLRVSDTIKKIKKHLKNNLMVPDTLKRGLLAAAVCMLVPMTSYAAQTDAAGEISVTVDHGYGNDIGAKGNRYLPVTLHLESSSEDAASGTVSIKVLESDGDIYEYGYPWELGSGTDTDVTYYIPLGYYSQNMVVKVADGDELIYSQRIDLNMDTDTESLFIGTLCDDPAALSWLDGESVDYGLLRTHVYDFDADDFPEDRRGLDMFDMIIVTDYRLRNLSEVQMRAMLDWVREGGVLLIGTGERVDDTLGRLAPELLDDRYSTPEMRELDITLGMDTDSPSDGIIETMQVTVPLHGASAIWRNDESTIISTVRKDSGLIAVASFDITKISDYAEKHSGYADRFLSMVAGNTRITQLAGETRRDSAKEYEYLNLLINAGDVDKLPPVRLQAAALLAYILLVGPGLYLFLKQHTASEYYRRGVLVLSLVFAALVYFIGSRTRLEGDLSKYVTVVMGDGESATETTFLNLRAPYAGAVEAEAEGDYTVLPVSAKSTEEPDQMTDNDAKSDVSITYGDGRVGINIASADEFAPKFFRLERTLESEDAMKTVTGDLELFEGKLSGTLINESGQNLSGAVVIGYGKMYLIGDMEAGETRVLTDVEMMNVPLSDSYNVAKAVFGDDEYEKTGILTFLRECYIEGYSADLRVAAWVQEDTQTRIRTEVECTGSKVLVSLIPTNRYRDGQICRPANIEAPTMVSGYYDPSSNTMFTDEEVVLEYSLGEDIDPSALYIEPVDDRFAGFDGTMYWYDIDAAVYEPISTQDGLVADETLRSHISEDNKVTIRYVYTGDRKNTYEVSLPMIEVVGSEH